MNKVRKQIEGYCSYNQAIITYCPCQNITSIPYIIIISMSFANLRAIKINSNVTAQEILLLGFALRLDGLMLL